MYLFDSWFFIIIRSGISETTLLKSWKKQKTRSLVWMRNRVKVSAQKMKFSIKDFFSKCDQIHSFLRIWSHLLKKSFMENFIFFLCIECFFVCFYRSDWLGGCGEGHPEAYSGPCQTSKMCFLFFVFVFFLRFFVQQLTIFAKSYILDIHHSSFAKSYILDKRLWHFLAFGLTLSRGRSLSHRN